jgi:hypothetical protein
LKDSIREKAPAAIEAVKGQAEKIGEGAKDLKNKVGEKAPAVIGAAKGQAEKLGDNAKNLKNSAQTLGKEALSKGRQRVNGDYADMSGQEKDASENQEQGLAAQGGLDGEEEGPTIDSTESQSSQAKDEATDDTDFSQQDVGEYTEATSGLSDDALEDQPHANGRINGLEGDAKGPKKEEPVDDLRDSRADDGGAKGDDENVEEQQVTSQDAGDEQSEDTPFIAATARVEEGDASYENILDRPNA